MTLTEELIKQNEGIKTIQKASTPKEREEAYRRVYGDTGRRKAYEGGFLSDVIDTLTIPNRAITAVAGSLINPKGGGYLQRYRDPDMMFGKLGREVFGTRPGTFADAAMTTTGFVADVLTDPSILVGSWALSPLKAGGKGILAKGGAAGIRGLEAADRARLIANNAARVAIDPVGEGVYRAGVSAVKGGIKAAAEDRIPTVVGQALGRGVRSYQANLALRKGTEDLVTAYLTIPKQLGEAEINKHINQMDGMFKRIATEADIDEQELRNTVGRLVDDIWKAGSDQSAVSLQAVADRSARMRKELRAEIREGQQARVRYGTAQGYQRAAQSELNRTKKQLTSITERYVKDVERLSKINADSFTDENLYQLKRSRSILYSLLDNLVATESDLAVENALKPIRTRLSETISLADSRIADREARLAKLMGDRTTIEPAHTIVRKEPTGFLYEPYVEREARRTALLEEKALLEGRPDAPIETPAVVTPEVPSVPPVQKLTVSRRMGLSHKSNATLQHEIDAGKSFIKDNPDVEQAANIRKRIEEYEEELELRADPLWEQKLYRQNDVEIAERNYRRDLELEQKERDGTLGMDDRKARTLPEGVDLLPSPKKYPFRFVHSGSLADGHEWDIDFDSVSEYADALIERYKELHPNLTQEDWERLGEAEAERLWDETAGNKVSSLQDKGGESAEESADVLLELEDEFKDTVIERFRDVDIEDVTPTSVTEQVVEPPKKVLVGNKARLAEIDAELQELDEWSWMPRTSHGPVEIDEAESLSDVSLTTSDRKKRITIDVDGLPKDVTISRPSTVGILKSAQKKDVIEKWEQQIERLNDFSTEEVHSLFPTLSEQDEVWIPNSALIGTAYEGLNEVGRTKNILGYHVGRVRGISYGTYMKDGKKWVETDISSWVELGPEARSLHPLTVRRKLQVSILDANGRPTNVIVVSPESVKIPKGGKRITLPEFKKAKGFTSVEAQRRAQQRWVKLSKEETVPEREVLSNPTVKQKGNEAFVAGKVQGLKEGRRSAISVQNTVEAQVPDMLPEELEKELAQVRLQIIGALDDLRDRTAASAKVRATLSEIGRGKKQLTRAEQRMLNSALRTTKEQESRNEMIQRIRTTRNLLRRQGIIERLQVLNPQVKGDIWWAKRTKLEEGIKSLRAMGLSSEDADGLMKTFLEPENAMLDLLVERGVYSPMTAVAMKDAHARRIYLIHQNPHLFLKTMEEHPEAMGVIADMLRKEEGQDFPEAISKLIKAAKERKDLSEEQMQLMGKIDDALLRSHEGLRLGNTAAQEALLFDKIAADFGLDDSAFKRLYEQGMLEGDIGVAGEAASLLPKQVSDSLGSTNTIVSRLFSLIANDPADYVRVTGARWGKLDGLWIPKEVERTLKWELHGAKALPTNKIWQYYGKVLNLWKIGKVILSPAARSRNIQSNVFRMWTELGMRPEESIVLMAKARWKDAMHAPGGAMDQMRKVMPLTSQTDLLLDQKAILSAQTGVKPSKVFGRVSGLTERGVKKAIKWYQDDEWMGKVAIWEWGHKKGWTDEQCVDAIKRTLFDYSRAPRYAAYLSDTGIIPFARYPSLAIPQEAKTFMEKNYRYRIMANAKREAEGFNESPEDELTARTMSNKDESKLLLKVPWAHERSFDLTYPLPVGGMLDDTTAFGIGIGQYNPIASNPAWNTYTGLSQNKDTFTGQPIVTDTRTIHKLGQQAQFVGQQLLPQWFPLVGYGYMNAVTKPSKGMVDAFGDKASAGWNAMNVFGGVKTTLIDPAHNEAKLAMEYKTMERELQWRIGEYKRMGERNQLSPEDVERNIISLHEQFQRDTEEHRRKLDILANAGGTP